MTGTHPLSDTVVGNDLYRVKWDPTIWEHWTVPFGDVAGSFKLVEDTSDGVNRYTFSAPMFPRTMVVGQTYTTGASNQEALYPATGTCGAGSGQAFAFTTTLVSATIGENFGGSVGVTNGVEIRYSYLNPAGGTENEDSVYAWKPGVVSFGEVSWHLWHADPMTGAPVTEYLSTFTTATTLPPTAPDLSVAC
jgi:hypothetical protein